MRGALVVVAVAVLGCGGPAAPPAASPGPPPPSCAVTADHVATLVKDSTGRLRRTFAARCDEDHWSIETRACITGTRSLDDPKRCKDTLTPPQREALDRDLELAAKRPAPTSNLPAPCLAYRELIQRLASCDQLPESARASLTQAFEAMTAALATPDAMPPESMDALLESCKQAADALSDVGKAICGW